ncbi:hypothetical protein [Solirhodobacter olei]|uniref:outer membrane lipoprotein n=1 Tax=Solirhodobacter olei TaxID=2493082 RepID=UPI000FDBAF7E|nr:hypothetical protein [Solirhodobacter olei]
MLKPSMLAPAALAVRACDQSYTPYAQGLGLGYGAASPATYSKDGTIIHVRSATMERTAEDEQVVGAIAGGLVAAVIGHEFGAGIGQDLMTGAGVITGAVIGSNLFRRSGTYASQAWTIRLDSGSTSRVIQPSDLFRVGKRVRVVQREDEKYLER